MFEKLSLSALRKMVVELNLHYQIKNYSKLSKTALVKLLNERFRFENGKAVPRTHPQLLPPPLPHRRTQHHYHHHYHHQSSGKRRIQPTLISTNVQQHHHFPAPSAPPSTRNHLSTGLQTYHSMLDLIENKYVNRYGNREVDPKLSFQTRRA